MRSKYNLVVLFALCAILFFMPAKAFAQVVNNGDFEKSEPGNITATATTGWVISAEASISPAPVFEIVSDTVQHGNRALKVTIQGTGPNQWDIQAVSDSIHVTPGATYEYSIWAKSDKPNIQANFTVGRYSYSEYGAIRPATLTTTWKKFTMQITISDNETIIRAPIHFSYAGNAGAVIYVDNLQLVDINAPKKPVIVEAESGNLGGSFTTSQDGAVSYITTSVNNSNLGAPGDTSRIATYNVSFADTGYYSLYVRLRVGADGFNDDSFFYGRGFGEKNDTASAEWVFVNGLASAGFFDSSDVVYEAGAGGNSIWKWVNVTRNTYSGAAGDSFYVSADELTKTFQFASREDGLGFDKIAFGKTNLYYTVKNLDNGEPGSEEITQPDTSAVWNGPPLASKQPKFVGNVHSSAQIEKFEDYWNQVTPENAGKWGSVEGTRDVMNWTALDAAYNFAKTNKFPFHFHVLIWGAQQPSWISSLPADEQLAEIREWFQAVAQRYPDIDYLEVVNEPLNGHNPPDGTNGRANYKEALGGNGTTGWDWVINAFKMAREIFPAKTRLMLNDFSIISSSNSTTTYLNIIRLLKQQGLIDIIGEQGHAFTTTAAVATMKRNLDSLASTGVPIQITELDIDGTDDQAQLQSYKRIFPLLYEHPGVEGITLWGWRRGLWRDEQGAYLVNQNGSERASLKWLREYLDSVTVTPVSVEDVAEVPNNFYLYNNYPNPFNPVTNISFSLPVQSNVRIQLIDALGRVVKEITSGTYSSGFHNVTLNASDLASGVYFYKIEAGSFIDVKKLVLMK